MNDTEFKSFASHIRSKLHSSTCPGQGARGELAYIEHHSQTDDGRPRYYARLYVWDDNATAREVVGWFKEAGARYVQIDQQIHDEWNDIHEGRCEDGVRSWDILFVTEPRPPYEPPLTICVAEYQWQGQTRRLPAQELLDAIALECPPAPMTLAITIKSVPNPQVTPQEVAHHPV
jgi:hypothetical protein